VNSATPRSNIFDLSNPSAPPELPLFSDRWQSTLDWQPSAEQQAQFQALYAAVLAGNRHLNLTRITEPEDFWEKHLWDSLVAIASYLKTPDESPPLSVIDIGTGGGFPGFPIAIACPTWSVTLLDSTQKKVAFLQQVQELLNLSHVKPLVGRAEAIGQLPIHRAKYDLACVRAVGNASICTEFALPLVKTGGFAVLFRGQWTEEESDHLSQVAEKLGGEIDRIEIVETPLSQGLRHLVYLRKLKSTPSGFPRAIGVPTKSPL
jgi:16S rRNA (guanine527-N7)-methyltransferase